MSVTGNPDVQEIWTNALSDESAFWQTWFETKGGQWPDDYAERVDPSLPFQAELRQLIDAPEGSTVRVLDVGAGPLTMLGKVWPGRKLELMAVDPLANQYDAIMARVGVTPLIRTRAGDGEKLQDIFPAESFDLVHARNCLDHSYDPILCLKQMFALVKPGGQVVTDHFNNEAETENYNGLHQWNFSVEKSSFWRSADRLVVWRPGTKFDVQEHLGGTAKVSGRLSGRQVHGWIKKIG